MVEASSFIEKFSFLLGICVVAEGAADYRGRVLEARSYQLRRHEMTSEAAGEYRSLETLRFEKDTLADLKNFDPSVVSRKRWLSISGYKIPLPAFKKPPLP